METCFVIQPFDGGKFDKRYDDVLAPAASDAGLSPYRVDRDPNVTIPINEIEDGIAAARACVADISEDNPNVWFELGMAIAQRKEVVLICSKERKSRFPFDVQHRNILHYSTDSSSDFDVLRKGITARLKAMLSRQESLGSVARIAATSTVEGLAQHELAGLVSVAQRCTDPSESVTTTEIRADMERTGFTDVATTLAVRSLLRKGLIESTTVQDNYGSEYAVYRPTQRGLDWLVENQDQLTIRAARGYAPHSQDDNPF